jgi:general secretion pathway protein I
LSGRVTALLASINCAPREEWRSQDGFTLIEIIVALAILSLSLGFLLNSISTSIRRVDQAGRIAEAGSLAQSLLARVGPELPLTQGETTGDFGNGFRWHLTIEGYCDRAAGLQLPVGAYRVSVEILWNDGVGVQSVVLRTLRVGAGSRAGSAG